MADQHVIVKEKQNGRWSLSLDEAAMRALVSMVRLEMGNGFGGLDAAMDAGAKRLLAAINEEF